MSSNKIIRKPLLIGIIIDVSSSMRRNWKNDSDEEMPRIEVIRDALNKEIKRQSILHGEDRRNTDVFCLGMGFKKTEFLVGVNLQDDQEKILEGEPKKNSRVDIVCDVLALSELIPTKEELNSLKEQLNKKWNIYANSSLKRAQIEDEIYEKLRYYIHSALRDSAHLRLRHSLKYKLYVKLKGGKYTHRFSILKWMLEKSFQYVSYWEQRIEATSIRQSIRYFDSIQEKAREVFDKNTQNYIDFIKDKLQQFIDNQTNIILKLLTIGYSKEAVIDYFDETKALDLAQEIYAYLYKAVTESIALAWTKSRAILLVTEKDLQARIDYGQVKLLTEKCIQKYGWSILNPFVEQLVFDMFEKSFEASAKREINDWIEFSSRREIVRPLRQVKNVLPETFDKSVYSDEFIFGSTPIENAIHLSTARLLENAYRKRERILVIISDGEFDSAMTNVYTNLLKKSGVTIISLCITNKSIITNLLEKAPKWWPIGARVLFDASSIVEADHYLTKKIIQVGYELPEGVKLFYQINQSKILTEIIEAIFSQ